jgi:hypothetical protein
MHEITTGLVFEELRRLERVLIAEHENASKLQAAWDESRLRIGEIEERITILRTDLNDSVQEPPF